MDLFSERFSKSSHIVYALIGKRSHFENSFQWARLSLSVLVSLPCCDGCLWGVLNEPLIRLIKQQIECGDVFGLRASRLSLSLCGRCTGQGSKAAPRPWRTLIGPLGAGVVGLLLQQAGRHVAATFPLGCGFLFHMQRMSHRSLLPSLHIKPYETTLNLLLTPAKNSLVTLICHREDGSTKANHGFLISCCWCCLTVIKVHWGRARIIL